MILALDTATTTGWAAGRPGETPTFGIRNFAGEGGTGEVVSKFRAWLNARCYELKPRLMVIEAPFIPQVYAGKARPGQRPINAATLRRLLALVETAHSVAWELRIPCDEAVTQDIAQFFTGQRRFAGSTADQRRAAKKRAVIERCRLYGWDVKDDDNAADALALWAMAEGRVAPALSANRGIGKLFPPGQNFAPRQKPRQPAELPPGDLFGQGGI